MESGDNPASEKESTENHPEFINPVGDALNGLKSTQPETSDLSRTFSTPSPRSLTAEPGERVSLENEVDQVIGNINAKRKEDNQLLTNFKDEVTAQVQSTINSVESSMFDLYDHQTVIIDAKVKELYATFDRISKIERELEQFRSSLQILYKDMQ